MLTAWRIVREHRAQGAFEGDGARLMGGRWNPKGVSMVYLSQHKSLAALETLVHLNPRMLFRYAAFTVKFDEEMVESIPVHTLPEGWNLTPPSDLTKVIGEDWARSKRSLLLQVPSAVIPEESNYLINPGHPDFYKMEISEPSFFAFDPRLVGTE